MLKMAKIEAIRDLHSRGCSMTKIAETVGVDRKTVKKYLEKEDFNRTVEDEAKAERKSKLDPYKPLIRELLEQQAEGKLGGLSPKTFSANFGRTEHLVRSNGALIPFTSER